MDCSLPRLLQSYFPIIWAVETFTTDYKAIGKIGEGTFSEVMKMQSLRDGSYYACKQMKQRFESIEQVNSLREIQALRRLNPHPNILTLHEVVFDRKSGSLALICELMDMNIYELIREHGCKQERKPQALWVCMRSGRGWREAAGAAVLQSTRSQPCHGHMRTGLLAWSPLCSPDLLLLNILFYVSKAEFSLRFSQLLPMIELLPLPLATLQNKVYLLFENKNLMGTRYSLGAESSGEAFGEWVEISTYTGKPSGTLGLRVTPDIFIVNPRCPLSCPSSLQPLFPGANELDQISKIHDVIGTPAQKTLTKFKQSRAMNFDFPFKKGSGIPLLTTNLSPQCLSLLHAMVAYDPDERIAAHQALQHPYFQEQRKTEKRALGSHRKVCFSEHPVAPEPLSNSWQISKESRKQKQSLKQEEDHPKRQGPAYAMELPKLKLSGVTKLSSYSSPTLQSELGSGTSGKVPVLRPLKFMGASKKTDPRKDLKPGLQQCRLPTLARKGGGY
ncbi:MAPK/MAK/MRK overlapping kinase [Cebus imitator]|uniref:MAPK/MAK/MRK overlapping kinase n=1 Tax=Cebus imitator TaxID=2715852 RepID=UPI0018979DDB|nr:MAPK/MAK/MRK overlapping kinase [Cebus imitator]